jgi:hypothetical protein
MSIKRDVELTKISKMREMAIFVKILNQQVSEREVLNDKLIEFAKDVLEMLDCYESIIIREKSNDILSIKSREN